MDDDIPNIYLSNTERRILLCVMALGMREPLAPQIDREFIMLSAKLSANGAAKAPDVVYQ